MTTAPLTVLQITDLHLLGSAGARLLGVDTAHSLRAVLDQAFSQRTPDVVLATGDITHHGDVAACERFVAILDEFHQGPRLVLPGNHDLAGTIRHLVLDPPLLTLPGWTIVGVDSHEDGQPGALLAAEDLSTLESACASASAAGRHVLVATHHPLLEVGCPWLDKDRIQNATELLESLAEHTTVAAIVSGHAHQQIEAQHRHIALFGTPSTCFQFAPSSEKFAIDMADTTGQPGYRWLELHGSGGVTSRVERVLDYPLRIDLTGARKPA